MVTTALIPLAAALATALGFILVRKMQATETVESLAVYSNIAILVALAPLLPPVFEVPSIADLGLSAELAVRCGESAPHQQRDRTDGRDLSGFSQTGTVEGTIRTDQGPTQISGTAVRTRSWGIEPVGERPEAGVPLRTLPSIHRYTLDAVFDRGTAFHRSGSLDDIQIEWVPGRRWPASAVVDGVEAEATAQHMPPVDGTEQSTVLLEHALIDSARGSEE